MAYKRYIEAVDLAEVIENLDIRVAGKPARWNDAKYSVLREISQAPDAEVEEVKHGEWILHSDGSATCNQCNTHQLLIWDMDRSQNYCGRCGAKMNGRNGENNV